MEPEEEEDRYECDACGSGVDNGVPMEMPGQCLFCHAEEVANMSGDVVVVSAVGKLVGLCSSLMGASEEEGDEAAAVPEAASVAASASDDSDGSDGSDGSDTNSLASSKFGFADVNWSDYGSVLQYTARARCALAGSQISPNEWCNRTRARDARAARRTLARAPQAYARSQAHAQAHAQVQAHAHA